MDLKDISKRCHGDAKKLGWYDSGKVKSDVESLMMVVTELAEAVEELRVPEAQLEYKGKNGKPEGVAVELADAVIRLLDLAEFKGIDLERVILEKLDFNLTRGYRHGNKTL